MTELTRQTKKDKVQRKKYIVYLSETKLNRRRMTEKGEFAVKQLI